MDSSEVLTTLLLCGFMGALGQGVRAAVGLKSAATRAAQDPSQQTEFDVAYFTLSLMIGFTAGILAGLAIGLQKFAKIDSNDPKSLLAIVAAGYAGTDFIENAFTNRRKSPYVLMALLFFVLASAGRVQPGQGLS